MKSWQVGVLAALFVLVVCVLLGALSLAMPLIVGPPTPTPTHSPTPTPRPTVTPRPTATRSPPTPTLAPRAEIEALVSNALALEHEVGRFDYEVPRIHQIEISMDPVSVYVKWAIDMALTAGLGKEAMWEDVRSVAIALTTSSYRIHELRMEGTYALTDLYGDTSEGTVLIVLFEEETLYRANWERWDGVDVHNIYKIADGLYLHPAMQW